MTQEMIQARSLIAALLREAQVKVDANPNVFADWAKLTLVLKKATNIAEQTLASLRT